MSYLHSLRVPVAVRRIREAIAFLGPLALADALAVTGLDERTAKLSIRVGRASGALEAFRGSVWSGAEFEPGWKLRTGRKSA